MDESAKTSLSIVDLCARGDLGDLERLLALDGAPPERCRSGVAAIARAIADFIQDSPGAPPPLSAAVAAELTRVAAAAAEYQSALDAMSDEARRYVRRFAPEHHLGLFPLKASDEGDSLAFRARVFRWAADAYQTKDGRRYGSMHAFRLFCRSATIWRACRTRWPALTNATATSRKSNREGKLDSPLLDALRDEVSRLAPGLSETLLDNTYRKAVSDRKAEFPLLEQARLPNDREAANLIEGDRGDPFRRPRDVLVFANAAGKLRFEEQEPSFKPSVK